MQGRGKGIEGDAQNSGKGERRQRVMEGQKKEVKATKGRKRGIGIASHERGVAEAVQDTRH